jgi:competence protein ComGC
MFLINLVIISILLIININNFRGMKKWKNQRKKL